MDEQQQPEVTAELERLSEMIHSQFSEMRSKYETILLSALESIKNVQNNAINNICNEIDQFNQIQAMASRSREDSEQRATIAQSDTTAQREQQISEPARKRRRLNVNHNRLENQSNSDSDNGIVDHSNSMQLSTNTMNIRVQSDGKRSVSFEPEWDRDDMKLGDSECDEEQCTTRVYMGGSKERQSLWFEALKSRAETEGQFQCDRQRRQYLRCILKKEHQYTLTGHVTSELIQQKLSAFYKFPAEYISVSRVGKSDFQFQFMTTKPADHRHLSFQIFMPNEGSYKSNRMPFDIYHSADSTADEMIRSILKLAVDIPLIGYAFFADVIRYVMKYELEEGSDYDPNRVDIAVLEQLDPSRFLIYSLNSKVPKLYYQQDRQQLSRSVTQNKTIKYGVQFLPLNDPLLTGATVVANGTEKKADGFDRSNMKPMWISIRNNTDEGISNIRTVIKRGETVWDVKSKCLELSNMKHKNGRNICRYGTTGSGKVELRVLSRYWKEEYPFFENVVPEFGYLTIWLPKDNRFFCKYMCGKDYAHNGQRLKEHMEKCPKRPQHKSGESRKQ